MGLGVVQYDNAYAVALAPKHVRSVFDVRLYRDKKHALERFLRDLVLLHSLLRMAADGHVAELWDVAVEVSHVGSLPCAPYFLIETDY